MVRLRRLQQLFGDLELGSKFIVISVSIILTIVSALAVYFISAQGSLLKSEIRKRATSLTENFAHACAYPVFLKDIPAIRRISRGIMNEEDVAFVRIYTEAGKILFEQEKDDSAKRWNDSIDAVPGIKDLALQLIETDSLLLVSAPVFRPANEKPSLDAPPSEPARARHIASVLVGFSLDETKKLIDASIRSTLLIAIAAIGIGIAMVLFIVPYLIQPLLSIVNATREISSGNFTYKVEKYSDDELGKLAVFFNEIAATLDNNTKTIERYSKDLERNVLERTEELRSREEELASILENNPTGIILVNTETERISWANSNALSMLKGSKEKIEGRLYRSYLYPACLPEYGDVPADKYDHTSESRLIATNGAEIPVLCSVSRITYKGRDHLLYAFFDITEYKKLEIQLIQAQKMGAIGTLAGGIAHDFNNLLQAISGYTQLVLMRGAINDADRNSLVQVEKSVRKGAELVKQLMTFSRKVESHPKLLDINSEIEKISELLERIIPKMIGIELNLSPDIWKIHADPLQFEQLIMNLSLNARDAMPHGGRLIFTTRNVVLDGDFSREEIGLKAGAYVLFSVSDTGTGLDKETLEHIFEPFFTTKEIGKGTGLGLSIVYGIVQGHKGNIICSSTPGEGTTFHIYFPAQKGTHFAHESTEEKKPKITGGHETVLLVDDEEPVLDVVRNALETHGYTVLTARSGEEAIEIFKEKRSDVDLVILDLGMPGMGGHRCLEELLSIDPQLKVIIASGYTDTWNEKEARNSGAAGFIGKPYQLHEMLDSVKRTLDSA